ncbi:NDR1/HIN1-like protein 13 [Punica granatum]|uniref:Uncharacterized protein n=2 Tax=Punica granatum TaxID=22663 RepID=A0A218X562_PUNGR|nr:NDR1/HIN1-like protein 13 [Punica granatum]OWM79938.1 hypothetical protein CDL15_Pgr006242 [Punica granatum]PKI73890.1 hypothetical protein CRG98_005760 [Punica granatum]
MAERATVPPADIPYDPDPDCASGPDSAFGPPPEPAHEVAAHGSFPSGTYVVQVPKDQIYRIPPSYNARIAELHKKRPPSNSKRSGCCKCFLCLFLVIVIVLIAMGIIIGISTLFAKPKNPVFQVDRLVFRNSTGSREYDLKLDAHNPNSRTGILYKEGGVASLHFKNNDIADGKYPSLHQGKKNTAAVLMVLKGSNSRLPEEIKESFKSGNTKVHVSFLLNISVPARMKFGFFSERTSDVAVTCKFTVDTLARGSRVLSQSCHTTRHRH